MDATLFDLKMEQWLRRRNAGEIKWTTREGKEIPINEMSLTHLGNTIAMLERAALLRDEHIAEIMDLEGEDIW